MPYIKLETEYLHSSGIVEFVWLAISFLALVVGVIRFVKLKIPIHGEDLDKVETKEPSQEIVKEDKNQSDIKKAKEADQNKPEDQKIEDPKNHEEPIKNENIQFAIDDNDQHQHIEKKEEEIKQDKDVQQIEEPRQVINLDEEKKEEPAKDAKSPEIDQLQKNRSLQETTLHIDEWVDKHLVSLTVAVLLINSWGCYIYTAFVTLLSVLFCCVFNRYNILGRMKEGALKDKRGFGDLIFHFWMLSLFVAYFVYDQSFSNNYTEYIP